MRGDIGENIAVNFVGLFIDAFIYCLFYSATHLLLDTGRNRARMWFFFFLPFLPLSSADPLEFALNKTVVFTEPRQNDTALTDLGNHSLFYGHFVRKFTTTVLLK